MACEGNDTLEMLMQGDEVGFQPWGRQSDAWVLCADRWPK